MYKPVGAWKTDAHFTTALGPDGRQHWREFPEPQHVPGLMSEWLAAFNDRHEPFLTTDTAARAYAEAHLDFVTIHPFFDGNGRMARLLANLPVLRAGLPPIVIPAENRREYKQAISDYQQTIPDLRALSRLECLPRNPERTRFEGLCAHYWGSTMALVAEARAAQARRHAVRQESSRTAPRRD
nr:Fic family protein [Acidiferrobacter sp. SPIII_3]